MSFPHIIVLWLGLSFSIFAQSVSLSLDDYSGGYNGTVTITNDTSEQITGWLVVLDFEGNLANSSNARLVADLSSGTTYAFQNETYNGTIGANASLTFNFSVSPDNDTTPSSEILFFPNWTNSAPVLSATAADTVEGDPVIIELSLEPAPILAPVTILYDTSALTATTELDYLTISGELTFDIGESLKIIEVITVDDAIEEEAETFQFSARGTELSTEISVLIQDNDSVEVIPQPYEEWLEVYFSEAEITNGEVSEKTGDVENDGLPNLLEYALGSNPLISDFDLFAGIEVDEDGNHFQHKLNRRAVEVEVSVSESEDLETWGVISENYPRTVTLDGESSTHSYLIDASRTERFFQLEATETSSVIGEILVDLDFESETVGSIPVGWQTFVNYSPNLSTSTDSIYVGDSPPDNSSSKALHVQGGDSQPAQIVKELPENIQLLYVKARFYMSKSMGNDPNDNHEHILGIKANQAGSFSADDEVRVGQGKGHLGFNHLPSDAISPRFSQWYSGPQTPVNEWFTVETVFEKNETYDTLKMYVDGELVNEVASAEDWHSSVPSDWLDGKLGFVFFGWHSFSQNAADVWIDDIIVSATYTDE